MNVSMSFCQTYQLLVHCKLQVYDLVCSDFGNITLFCFTWSGSVLSPLLQKLSERLTMASRGRDGLVNAGICTNVGKHYGIDHIQKVMTQRLMCNWHLWHSQAHILTAEDVNKELLPLPSSPMSSSLESGRKNGFCFVWNWLDHMGI
jgi:hypothetical protein